MSDVRFSQSYSKDHQITVFRARALWYVSSDEGGAYTGFVDCEHDHRTPEAADKCLPRLESAIRKNPAKYGLPKSDGSRR